MLKVDRTWTFANTHEVHGDAVMASVRAAGEAAVARAIAAGRKPVQIEVIVRVAPEGKK